MISVTIDILLTIHVIVALFIVLLVLMQRPKSEGLGATFGGEMMGDLFSANTSNVLAGITRWLGGAFFVLSLVLAVLYARLSTQHSAIQAAALRHAAAAAATASPSTAPLLPKNPLAVPAPSAAAFSGSTNLLSAPVAGATPALMPAPSLTGSDSSKPAGH